MKSIKINYIDTIFIVQSYLKNDFVNICEVNGDSFWVDFRNKKITTSAKETKAWKEKASKINCNELSSILESIFNDSSL